MTFSLDLIAWDGFVSGDLGIGLETYVKDHALSHIPPLDRRRLDRGARGVFTLVKECSYPIIFSSYQGESNRCFRMYESLKQEGQISPTTFSLSVLNAIPALLAILFKNQKEILALSHFMSLEYGLLNAYLLLSEGREEECLVLGYREMEDCISPDSLAIVAMRVRRGESLRLTKLDGEEKLDMRESRDSISEMTFLQNCGKSRDWLSFGLGETWRWNVVS